MSSMWRRGNLVKICGLRQPEHAAAAARAGADLISFIFAPARRQVTAEMAHDCIAAARRAAPGREIAAIGVFVNASAGDIQQIAAKAGLDAVQLQGDESPAFAIDLGLPVIRAIGPAPGTRATSVLADIERYGDDQGRVVGFLIDGYSSSGSGGTGIRADWALAAEVGLQRPVMLAGGLDEENVGIAIRQATPLGVDVSSGVEVDGVKDEPRIERFTRAAKAAFQAQAETSRAPHVQ